MRPRVYIETSVLSYLTALPSRDLVRAAHQQLTAEWWTSRETFDLYVSDAVLGFEPPIICTPEELHQKKEDA